MRSDVHPVLQNQEGGLDAGQRHRQRLGLGQIAADDVDSVREPGPLRSAGQRPHRRTCGGQLLYCLTSEVGRGTDDEIHEVPSCEEVGSEGSADYRRWISGPC